jgi:hypothetical protein
MSEEKKRGCFRQGALGCLALIGLGLVLLLGFGGLALLDSRRPTEIVQEELSAPVPVERAAPVATEEQLADARTSRGLGAATAGEGPTQLAGTLELELAMGDFELVPSDGDEIELEGEFDETRFRLDGTMEENDDGTWRYVVRFGARSRILPATGDNRNRVTIHVPRNLPLSVVGRVRMGQSRLELGGLSLRKVAIAAEMGDHTVSFSEPTPRPMDSFEVRGSMGEVDVVDLGNASPRTVVARHQMGELGLGLEGAWRNDCDVRGRWRMGQMSVDVGEDVHVEVGGSLVLLGAKNVRVRTREDLGPEAPTLRLDLGGAMGEVVVQ